MSFFLIGKIFLSRLARFVIEARRRFFAVGLRSKLQGKSLTLLAEMAIKQITRYELVLI